MSPWDRCWECDKRIAIIDGTYQACGWYNQSYSCFCSRECRIAHGLRPEHESAGPFCPDCGQRRFLQDACMDCGYDYPADAA